MFSYEDWKLREVSIILQISGKLYYATLGNYMHSLCLAWNHLINSDNPINPWVYTFYSVFSVIHICQEWLS